MRKLALSDAERRRIARLYVDQGLSFVELAARLHVSEPAARRRLHAAGIPARPAVTQPGCVSSTKKGDSRAPGREAIPAPEIRSREIVFRDHRPGGCEGRSGTRYSPDYSKKIPWSYNIDYVNFDYE